MLATPSFEGVALALVLLLPAAFLKEKAASVVMAILAECVGLVCLADIFCQEFFASSLSARIVQIVTETDAREAGEFLHAFARWKLLARWRIIGTVLLMPALPFAGFIPLSQKVARWWVAALALPGVIGLVSFVRDSEKALQASAPTRFAAAVAQLRREKSALESLRRSTLQAWPDSCSFDSPHVVLVIGESFNKHHASAYGYPLETTPCLDARAREGSLAFFADAVSPWNFTVNALTAQFSLTPDGPLYPILLRRAGYAVNFYSNQYAARKDFRDQDSGLLFFLRDSLICAQLFDSRNPRKFKYDLDLVTSVPLPQGPCLDMIQLMGQHCEYSHRYPESFGRFPEAYDNATLYVDFVLDSLLFRYENSNTVVVFVSDHGESVGSPGIGRSHGKPTLEVARDQFEVPMFIWCSPAYADAHPGALARIREASARPFYTRDISQLILGLTGLHSPWTQPSLNVLSPSYVPPRRVLAGTVDYDQL